MNSKIKLAFFFSLLLFISSCEKPKSPQFILLLDIIGSGKYSNASISVSDLQIISPSDEGGLGGSHIQHWDGWEDRISLQSDTTLLVLDKPHWELEVLGVTPYFNIKLFEDAKRIDVCAPYIELFALPQPIKTRNEATYEFRIKLDFDKAVYLDGTQYKLDWSKLEVQVKEL